MEHDLFFVLTRLIDEAEYFDSQYGEDAGHQVEHQATEEGEDERAEKLGDWRGRWRCGDEGRIDAEAAEGGAGDPTCGGRENTEEFFRILGSVGRNRRDEGETPLAVGFHGLWEIESDEAVVRK